MTRRRGPVWTRTSLGALFTIGLLILVSVPGQTAHLGTCDDGPQTSSCQGGWKISPVVNPLWWETDQLYEHEKDANNRPGWIHIKTTDGSTEPYRIRVEVSGNSVGSLDVYKAQPGTNGEITPECPQDLILDFLPEDEAETGSPGHISQLRHATLEHHRTVVPAPLSVDWTPGITAKELVMELDRSTEWVLVFDSRAGTDLADGVATVDGAADSRIDFEITVDQGKFGSTDAAILSSPLDVSKWISSPPDCLSLQEVGL